MNQPQGDSIEISLKAVPSKLQVSGGKEIHFSRAILSMQNTGNTEVVGVVPHASLGQEGGSVQDVTGAFSKSETAGSIPPGGTLIWDVYDLLIPAHGGVASKVHMFGYRAILNWWFDLSAWTEYRPSDVATPLHTPTSRWKLRWSPKKSPADEIDITVEVVEA